MLFRLLKKISKNYGVFLSLFFGIILSLVIINCTVIYGNSLKDSLFQKILTNYERKHGETAGTVLIHNNNMDLHEGFSKEVENYNKLVLDRFNMNINTGRSMAIAEYSVFWDEDTDITKRGFYNRDYQLISIKDFKDHIDIIQGRIFNNSFVQGNKNVVEVVVDKKTMIDLRLEIDKLYRMELVDKIKHESILNLLDQKLSLKQRTNYFKIVGVYELKENDVFWRKGIWKNIDNSFVVHENVLSQLCRNEKGKIKLSSEYFIDFSKFKYSDRNEFLNELYKAEDEYSIINSQFVLNIKSLINDDNKNFRLVNNMLWIIQIPVLAILFLYILMITGVIVERDKDEIALLKSRGATSFNILSNYLFDGVVILAVGLLVAPVFSLFAAKYMSTTSGFLEFNGEYSRNIYFTKNNIYFSIVTSIVFLCALFIPVIKATRVGIVNRRQSKVRIKFSTWKKTFIDFILIGVGFYGFNLFMNSRNVANDIKLDINFISLDPLIFISATAFSFGLSLFFLRIYPYLIKFILKTFKKIMPAHLFVLFSNLGRKGDKREYTMLFIMIMISSSIFNLKIARTINTNVLDNVKYMSGSEIKMVGHWVKDRGHDFKGSQEIEGDSHEAFESMDAIFDVTHYTELIEPDYSQFESLQSLETIAKVMKIQNINLKYSGLTIDRVNIIAIEPKQFGEVAYMREDLTPVHWYNYLNILAKQPEAIFLSSNMKDLKKREIKPGDLIEVEIHGLKENLIFGGYIDYWPEYQNKNEYILVGNFNYIYSRLARWPYEIWGKLKEGKKESDLLKELEEKSITIAEFSSISEFTKENIFIKAVNASITISFILSMIVTLLGFMIYWCICIKERELQFGILRSLGLKIRKIYTMIFVEQILVTGTSLIVGIGIGQFISSKFLPVVTEIVFGNSLVLPIVDYIANSDYLLIVAIFIISVIFVLVIILKYISTIKISQAIKIGED
ncbi:ABC transporter permease [Oceanirhabdus sp. W0125-5]|uniref:ABC transporter permease n=1 Tax=Oceanirhabdus sp. W0125-5 TaxID=2999116 RepID=UPI0022F2CE11|nr:ABC transporter permease [Oceanirhabdus sp. W0125-5]WBW94965.1 ABC transporter permease [Oceanirhabdus sp. W0125-5]